MSDEGQMPINQHLLNEALKLKEERGLVKDRLLKVEASREQVSASVYQKVRGDYHEKLKGLNDQLLQKKQELDRELAVLYESKDKIEANLKNHKEKLEEIEFRHKLGEFDKGEYAEAAKTEKEKVTRFEKVMTAVESNIQRYEAVFKGEEDLFGESGADAWEEEAVSSQSGTPTREAEPPEGGTPLWLESTNPNIGGKPRITVISGSDHVGKQFIINGTFTMGRSQANQLPLKDAKVSRQHAEIKLRGTECLLIDLNSSNGTMVNGQKINEHILAENDEIQIGDFVLQFQQ